ncbi:hypothetical protein NL676_027006 [Syzygium grande]|nr:hypothetical protein NL676_027006 [Syzygium grande]
MVPLQLRGVRHAILVGDECQLPAMVESKLSSKAGFGRSLFERLGSLGRPRHLLNVQYRMHPAIKCYQQKLRKCHLPWPMFGPYSFINISNGSEEREDDGRSLRNHVEVGVASMILRNLYRACKSSGEVLSVGVISPYSAQVAAIQKNIGKDMKNIKGFTAKRTNVTITRARYSLWILGNERTLKRSKSVWGALVHDAKSRGCFFSIDDVKAALDGKNNQLDDPVDQVVYYLEMRGRRAKCSSDAKSRQCSSSTDGRKPFWMGSIISLMIRSLEVVYYLEMHGGGQSALVMLRAENVKSSTDEVKAILMGRIISLMIRVYGSSLLSRNAWARAESALVMLRANNVPPVLMKLKPFWMGRIINLMIRSMEVIYYLKCVGGARCISDAKSQQCSSSTDGVKAILDGKKENIQLDDPLGGNSDLFRNARWRVFFGDNFVKSFRKLTSLRTKMSIMNPHIKTCQWLET